MSGSVTNEAVTFDQEGSRCGILVDTAPIPGGGQLELRKLDQHYEIVFGDEQLMGSWAFGSEQALATLVASRLGARAGRVLIGGLGMGFTLAAARHAFPERTKIVVAELVPGVVDWARGRLAHLFADAFSDPSVSIDLRDVHDVIVEHAGAFDAILLDVDNGPDGLIQLANERLYCNWGLRAARAALRPHGILAIWSAFPDEGFSQRLEGAGFAVEMIRSSDGSLDGADHIIWLATSLSAVGKVAAC